VEVQLSSSSALCWIVANNSIAGATSSHDIVLSKSALYDKLISSQLFVYASVSGTVWLRKSLKHKIIVYLSGVKQPAAPRRIYAMMIDMPRDQRMK
jgi:hypothetical protein